MSEDGRTKAGDGGLPARVLVYDTTLRDGCQAEGVNLSVEDKLRVARLLDQWGVAFIEGGWPNETAPRDRRFFEAAREIEWRNARLCAFGSTCRAESAAEDDSNLQYLVGSGAPTITIFGMRTSSDPSVPGGILAQTGAFWPPQEAATTARERAGER